MKNKDTIIGFRTTEDFNQKFDLLCHQLGHKRSAVARRDLVDFVHKASTEKFWFDLAKSELY